MYIYILFCNKQLHKHVFEENLRFWWVLDLHIIITKINYFIFKPLAWTNNLTYTLSLESPTRLQGKLGGGVTTLIEPQIAFFYGFEKHLQVQSKLSAKFVADDFFLSLVYLITVYLQFVLGKWIVLAFLLLKLQPLHCSKCICSEGRIIRFPPGTQVNGIFSKNRKSSLS